MPLVLEIAPASAFCYQRDMPRVMRQGYERISRRHYADPYGSMVRDDGNDDDGTHLIPRPRVRLGYAGYEFAFDRKSRGKGFTLRSYRDPRSFGADNPKSTLRKITLRITFA